MMRYHGKNNVYPVPMAASSAQQLVTEPYTSRMFAARLEEAVHTGSHEARIPDTMDDGNLFLCVHWAAVTNEKWL